MELRGAQVTTGGRCNSRAYARRRDLCYEGSASPENQNPLLIFGLNGKKGCFPNDMKASTRSDASPMLSEKRFFHIVLVRGDGGGFEGEGLW